MKSRTSTTKPDKKFSDVADWVSLTSDWRMDGPETSGTERQSLRVWLSRSPLERELDPEGVKLDTGGSVRPCVGYIFNVLQVFQKV